MRLIRFDMHYDILKVQQLVARFSGDVHTDQVHKNVMIECFARNSIIAWASRVAAGEDRTPVRYCRGCFGDCACVVSSQVKMSTCLKRVCRRRAHILLHAHESGSVAIRRCVCCFLDVVCGRWHPRTTLATRRVRWSRLLNNVYAIREARTPDLEVNSLTL